MYQVFDKVRHTGPDICSRMDLARKVWHCFGVLMDVDDTWRYLFLAYADYASNM